MNRLQRHFFISSAALALATSGSACAEEFVPFGPDVEDETDASGGDTDDVSSDDVPDVEQGYPAGPYGVGVGDTVADMTFTQHDGTNLALSDYFNDTGARLVLISTSAEWCSACREEQPLLQDLFNDYRDDGFRVMVTIFEDSNFSPADISHVVEWRAQYRLSFNTVLDAGNSFSDFYDTSLTPMNMFVDTQTMQIVSLQTGAIAEDESRSLIEVFVD
ncbi:MAG: peroxiredoxin [Bradymonadia bacterium]|jgi:peroxiredoxin